MHTSTRIWRVLSAALFAGFLSVGTVVAPAQADITPTPTATASTSSLKSLNIKPEAQAQNLWCWAGASTAVANYFGANVSQNEFCNLAKGNPNRYAPCANSTGDLNDIRRGWYNVGVYGSTTRYGTLTFSEIKREIDAGRPVQVRIQWNSNGMGHFLVIEGYNAATQEIQWIDPWPTSQRVNVAKYSSFLNDSRYKWTHSITNIGVYGTPKDVYSIY